MKFIEYDNLLKSRFKQIVVSDDDGNQKNVEVNPEELVFPRVKFFRNKITRWKLTYSVTVETKSIEEMDQILEQIILVNLIKISNENIKLGKNQFERIDDFRWRAEWELENVDYLAKKWDVLDKDKNE